VCVCVCVCVGGVGSKARHGFPALEKLRQEFQASLGYTVRTCLNGHTHYSPMRRKSCSQENFFKDKNVLDHSIVHVSKRTAPKGVRRVSSTAGSGWG
jgi:hypothetical protein